MLENNVSVYFMHIYPTPPAPHLKRQVYTFKPMSLQCQGAVERQKIVILSH